VCPITATLSPKVPFVGISYDFMKITVFSEWLGLSDVGTHNFVLTVSSGKNKSMHKTYSLKFVFNFGDPCPKTEIVKPLIKPMTFSVGSKAPVI
jgi:hypothetical protein